MEARVSDKASVTSVNDIVSDSSSVTDASGSDTAGVTSENCEANGTTCVTGPSASETASESDLISDTDAKNYVCF